MLHFIYRAYFSDNTFPHCLSFIATESKIMKTQKITKKILGIKSPVMCDENKIC